MSIRSTIGTAALALSLTLLGCAGSGGSGGGVGGASTAAPAATSTALAEPASFPDELSPFAAAGWAPENKAKIEAFVRENGVHSSKYDPRNPPTAAFDWDMTSIFNDVGDATFYFQVRNLHLKLSPQELAQIVPDKFVKTGQSVAAERQEMLDAYQALFDNGVAGDTGLRLTWRKKLEIIKSDPNLMKAYEIFRYRMIWFYQQLDEVDGATVAYPWVVRLYANLTPNEVATLMDRVLRHELKDAERGERCTTLTISHPDEKKWAGNAKSPIDARKIRHGIVANPEMRELYTALRANGVDVYVVTASFKGTVERIASRLYGVPADHVIGIRLQQRQDGSFTDQVITPITYRQGKVDNIRMFLPREPIFSAGDSNTDVEMLTMSSVQLRLILDRKKGGDIGKLYERARQTDKDHYLIQGRNDYGQDGTALGTWNASTETR